MLRASLSPPISLTLPTHILSLAMPPRKKITKNSEETSQAQQPNVTVECMYAFILFFFSDHSCN